MTKRRLFAIVFVVSFMTVISCGRKGTGCPTFSKVNVTSATVIPV